MTKQPITQHFLTARERPPELVAIRFKRHKSWLDLSWQEYYRRAEAVAVTLADLGVESGDRVAVLSGTRWEWAALDFAILGLGAVTVPIYQSSRAEEIEFILNHCEPRVLVLEDRAQLRKWESIARRCRSVERVILLQIGDATLTSQMMAWEDLLSEGAKSAAARPEFYAGKLRQVKLDDLATIVYTSGTTGEPKGAVLTHRQILAEVESTAAAFPISTQDSTLSFLPYAHVLGRVELWLHTYVGFTLNLAENIDRLKTNLREAKPTALIGVPRIFEKVFAGVMTELQGSPWRKNAFAWLDGGFGLQWARHLVLDKLLYTKLREGLGGRLRFAISGGAPLEAQISEFFDKAGILVLEGYGLTETTAAVTVNTLNAYRFGTVGRPLAGVEIKLAADGEILVKSDVVMKAYYKDEAATREAFQDGYFLTGDIGEWTSDGFLRITDRKKDLIKTAGGKYVAPQKLEGLLKLEPLVSHALIHGDRKKYVVALIALDEAAAKKKAREQDWKFRDYKSLTQSPELREYIRKAVAQANAQLASYETIKAFAILPNDFTIENGELTPSLKVKRHLCDERYKDIIESLY